MEYHTTMHINDSYIQQHHWILQSIEIKKPQENQKCCLLNIPMGKTKQQWLR